MRLLADHPAAHRAAPEARALDDPFGRLHGGPTRGLRRPLGLDIFGGATSSTGDRTHAAAPAMIPWLAAISW